MIFPRRGPSLSSMSLMRALDHALGGSFGRRGYSAFLFQSRRGSRAHADFLGRSWVAPLLRRGPASSRKLSGRPWGRHGDRLGHRAAIITLSLTPRLEKFVSKKGGRGSLGLPPASLPPVTEKRYSSGGKK